MIDQKLQVRGQLQNKTWSNIGVTWKPVIADENNNPHGGLTVNSMMPMLRISNKKNMNKVCLTLKMIDIFYVVIHNE